MALNVALRVVGRKIRGGWSSEDDVTSSFGKRSVLIVLLLVGYHPPLQSGWMLGGTYSTLDDDLITIPRFLLAPEFYARPADRPLVLAIGDSFTQGYPVDAEQTYPAVLQQRLAARGVQVDVANAGMGDSGPDQQLRLLETRLLPRLRPAVVVWTFYANDLWDNVLKPVYTIEEGRLVPISSATHWIAFRQRLFDAVPPWFARGSWAFHALLHATEAKGVDLVPSSERADPTAWAARKLRLELASFDRLAHEARFTPYVVLIAPQSRYLDAGNAPAHSHAWSSVEHGKLAALLGELARPPSAQATSAPATTRQARILHDLF